MGTRSCHCDTLVRSDLGGQGADTFIQCRNYPVPVDLQCVSSVVAMALTGVRRHREIDQRGGW